MAALKKLSVGAMKPWFPQSNLGESSFTCAFLLEKLRENCEQFRDFEKKFKVVNVSFRFPQLRAKSFFRYELKTFPRAMAIFPEFLNAMLF